MFPTICSPEIFCFFFWYFVPHVDNFILFYNFNRYILIGYFVPFWKKMKKNQNVSNIRNKLSHYTIFWFDETFWYTCHAQFVNTFCNVSYKQFIFETFCSFLICPNGNIISKKRHKLCREQFIPFFLFIFNFFFILKMYIY